MTTPVIADRIRRAREIMASNGWDFVLATSPETVFYLSGALIHTQMLMRRRQCAVIVAPTGDTTLIVPEIERDLATRKSGLERVVTYNVLTETVASAAAELLRPLAGPGKKVALEKTHLPVFDFEDLERSLPNVQFGNADLPLQTLRVIKSREEIAIMELAASTMEQAIIHAVGSARAGTREDTVAAQIGQHVQRLGGGRVRSVTGLVASGANLHTAHHIADATQLKAGDVLRAGCRAVFDGYNGIVNRTAVVGDCDPGTLDYYKRVHQVHRELLDRLRPGAIASEIHEHVSGCYRALGLSPTNPHFGYATGLEFQERPKLAPNSNDVLAPGMVILAESVSKEARGGHFYIVDMVAIETDGARNLSAVGDISTPLVIRET